jgi:pre-mRNA-splicing factor ATP-dependent RNA helicase DHX38/PRP16
METPSNPGGISESALKRMQDMKRRDRNRGAGYYESSRDDHKRHDEESSSSSSSSSKRRDRGEGSSTATPRRGGLIKRSDWSSMTPRDKAFTPRSAPGNMTPRHDSGYRKSTGGSTRKSTDWNYMTPAVKSTAYDEVALEYPEEYEGDGYDRQKWEEEQAQLDREWYQMEDGGVSRPLSIYIDTIFIPFLSTGDG